jgi:hypothetical protein
MRRLKRVENPESLSDTIAAAFRVLAKPRELLATLRDYVGVGGRRQVEPIVDIESLQRFLDTRASFVAQTSLYGYVRTRSGMRYPELFDNDGFVGSMNVAKWQIWLACLSDLSVYAGGLIAGTHPDAGSGVGRIIRTAVSQLLATTGVPTDAGPAFASSSAAVQERLASCDWSAVTDDAAAFTESPPALVRWAPIVDEMKVLDEPIVLNSVRFRWQEVRRELRRSLDAGALLADEAAFARPVDSIRSVPEQAGE